MKSDTLLKLIHTKDFVIPKELFLNYRKLNISEKELIFLSFLLNKGSFFLFDAVMFSEELNFDITEVIECVSSLVEKKLIHLEVKKQNGKMTEYIDVSLIYDKLSLLLIDEEVSSNDNSGSDIYSLIESEFGRTLSGIECETIADWLNSNISEDLIKEALKEAILNGVSNLKYIDKILIEWVKNGYKKPKDIKRVKKEVKKDLFDYDWLEEN